MTVTPRALLVCAAVSFAALAASPAPPQPQPPPPPPAQRRATAAPADEDLMEFLGDDDIPDQKWWQFMKRKAPNAPVQQPVPQDSQQ